MLRTNDLFKTHLAKNKELIQLTDEDVEKVQKELLKIAYDVINICEKNGINYSLAGGSVLGAVRHNGFIPWDDDLDIIMTRENSIKFVECFSQCHSDKYWIHIPGETENYDSLYIKIRKKGTAFKNFVDLKEDEAGLALDIFIIDNTYNNKLKRKIHEIVSDLLSFIISCYRIFLNRRKFYSLFKDDKEVCDAVRIKSMLSIPFRLLKFDTWLRIANKWYSICKDNKSRYVAIPTGRRHFYGETYKRDKLCEVVKHKFEDFEWNIPIDYDGYLKKLYGDYMVIPKHNQIEVHALSEFKL